MARTLKLSATYNLGSGDGVSAETQSANASLSSGLSTMIAGSAPTAGKEYTVADFLGTGNKAKGVYFENTDSTNYITLLCSATSAAGDICAIQVKAGGVVMFHDDSDTIAFVKVTANTAAASYVLSFCE